MIKINLRYYVYVSTGVAVLVLLLIDPDLRASLRVAELFGSLRSLTTGVFAAFR